MPIPQQHLPPTATECECYPRRNHPTPSSDRFASTLPSVNNVLSTKGVLPLPSTRTVRPLNMPAGHVNDVLAPSTICNYGVIEGMLRGMLDPIRLTPRLFIDFLIVRNRLGAMRPLDAVRQGKLSLTAWSGLRSIALRITPPSVSTFSRSQTATVRSTSEAMLALLVQESRRQ